MVEIESEDRERFRRDGVVVLRDAIAPYWIERLSDAVEANMASPGVMANDYTQAGADGRYFGDYCNWDRIDGFRAFAFQSKLGEMAGVLMGASRVQLFHEHVLVKEPGTAEATPWHHDQPYYVVGGTQVISFWVPLDPVPAKVCPRFVRGSHRWGKLFYPRRFLDGSDYDYRGAGYESVPDIDAEPGRYDIAAWDLRPGDAIAFHFLTLHNAPDNITPTRRRAVAWRFLGDDTCWATRPGEPSPPYPKMGLVLKDGDPLPEDWFPVVWSHTSVGANDAKVTRS